MTCPQCSARFRNLKGRFFRITATSTKGIHGRSPRPDLAVLGGQFVRIAVLESAHHAELGMAATRGIGAETADPSDLISARC